MPVSEPTGDLRHVTSRLDAIDNKLDQIESAIPGSDELESAMESALRETLPAVPTDVLKQILSCAEAAALGVWIVVAIVVWEIAC